MSSGTTLTAWLASISAGEGRIVDGRAVRREKLHPESPRGHLFCGECNAYNRFVSSLLRFRERYTERTLEGVWMSVSPTQDALIVALDFEGGVECILYSVFNTTLNSTRNRRP